MSTTRQRNTYLCAKYRRIAARRGKLKAVVAIERAILIAVWHMLSAGTYYQDPGPDYYSRHDRSKRAARAVRALRALGYSSPRHRGQLSRPTHQFRINEEVSGLRPALKDESTASTTCVG
jgi:hypothetical protein